MKTITKKEMSNLITYNKNIDQIKWKLEANDEFVVHYIYD